MAIRSLKIIRPIIWIPPIYTASYKLTVERDDGTIDDLTNLAHAFEINDGVTESIGSFSFELYNPNETYTDVWNGNEIFRYYSDYASTATTLRFRGRIERVSYENNAIKVNGRGEALFFMEKTVTQSYTSANCDTILKDLIDKYGAGFTYNNVASSSTLLTVNWSQKPFWDCVKELCVAAGFDAYVDSNKDWHFFIIGSRTNINEAIVHNYNLMEVRSFANDLSLIRNRIIVYGAQQEGIQIVYTANDATSQSQHGIREEIINDGNITNYTQAQEFGDAILEDKKNPPQTGEVKGILLATLQPGEKIRLSSPSDNIQPANYDIVNYRHSLDDSGLFTSVTITKEPRKISHVFRDVIERQNASATTSINPYEMSYSYDFLFDEDNGSHSSTQITNGVLKLTGASGNWISPSRATATNLDECYLIVNGETLTGASYEVSGDNGINYQVITNGERIIMGTAKGSYLRIRVTFTNIDTQITSLSIQYKLD